MAIVRSTKKVDSKNRVALPKEWCAVGETVYFEITKSGNLVIHKAKTEEPNKETSSNS